MKALKHDDCNVTEASTEAFLDTCIEYKIASTRWEREGAFQLVYNAYRRDGLVKADTRKMRITPHHLLPTTNVMVARYANQIISTLSLMEDGQLGLPLEGIFTKEVDQRRESGLYLAEASCLADRRKDIKRYFPVFMRLCRLMIQFARKQGIDQLLIAVHPRHVRLYTQYLAFDPIAGERPYPMAQHQPAVMLSLDLKRLEIERPVNYDRFFGNAIDPALLQPHPMCPSERDHFRSFLENPIEAILVL